jgi:hypothetical protein
MMTTIHAAAAHCKNIIAIFKVFFCDTFPSNPERIRIHAVMREYVCAKGDAIIV